MTTLRFRFLRIHIYIEIRHFLLFFFVRDILRFRCSLFLLHLCLQLLLLLFRQQRCFMRLIRSALRRLHDTHGIKLARRHLGVSFLTKRKRFPPQCPRQCPIETFVTRALSQRLLVGFFVERQLPCTAQLTHEQATRATMMTPRQQCKASGAQQARVGQLIIEPRLFIVGNHTLYLAIGGTHHLQQRRIFLQRRLRIAIRRPTLATCAFRVIHEIEACAIRHQPACHRLLRGEMQCADAFEITQIGRRTILQQQSHAMLMIALRGDMQRGATIRRQCFDVDSVRLQ
mmetsp:Transcript_25595/g.41789  ORF Transcript_25595/g.41789 Transcript_25595/m.41789 type:complete len:286 (+) Transcript_25595:362-1219(+)